MNKLKSVWDELRAIEEDERQANLQTASIPHTEAELNGLRQGFKNRRAQLPKKADAALRERRQELMRRYQTVLKARSLAAEASAARWDSLKLLEAKDRARGLVKSAVEGVNVFAKESIEGNLRGVLKAAARQDAHMRRAILEAVSEKAQSLAHGDEVLSMSHVKNDAEAELQSMTQTEAERAVLEAESAMTAELAQFEEEAERTKAAMPDLITFEQHQNGQPILYQGILDGLQVTRDGPTTEIQVDETWEAPVPPAEEEGGLDPRFPGNAFFR